MTEFEAHYLILTDAHGTSLLAGFPVDPCRRPHAGVVYDFRALPWRTVSEQDVQAL